MSLWMCGHCHSLQGFSKDMICFACGGPLSFATVHPPEGFAGLPETLQPSNLPKGAPLPAERIAQIRARQAEASKGPWWAAVDEEQGVFPVVIRFENGTQRQTIARLSFVRDNEFVAHSRQDIDDLLKEVDRLLLAVASLRSAPPPQTPVELIERFNARARREALVIGNITGCDLPTVYAVQGLLESFAAGIYAASLAPPSVGTPHDTEK